MNTVMMVLGVIFILSFYGGINYYIAKRIYQWLSLLFPQISVTLFLVVYIFIALTLVVSFLPVNFGFKHIINWIGSHWMGIFVYLLVFILMADLVVLLGGALRIIPRPTPQIVRFCTGLAVVLLTTVLVSYGRYKANRIKYVSYDIQAQEKSLSDDMKIVLISDLHLGAVNSENKLAEIVQGINDLQPDIVCIAGDLFDNNYFDIKNSAKAIDLLKSISTKYGVYACLGNHDGGSSFSKMLGFMEQSNIKLLNDEHIVIDERLVLVGRIDAAPIGGFGELKRRDTSDVLTSIGDTDLPVVVMDHNPSNIGQYGENVDLILSGHTHHGQIFPANLITKSIFTVDYGHYQKDSNSPHVIVSSGVGTWGMPMRLGTDSEIISIELH